jgi:hypothetical protein
LFFNLSFFLLSKRLSTEEERGGVLLYSSYRQLTSSRDCVTFQRSTVCQVKRKNRERKKKKELESSKRIDFATGANFNRILLSVAYIQQDNSRAFLVVSAS